MKKIIVIALAIFIYPISGCYYDDKETLYPATSCDTTSVTYAAVIKPIIVSNCAYSSCHVSPAPASGLDLSTVTGLQAVALNGKLTGVINHASGFSPMPKGGSKLSDCNIRQITKWTSAGAQDN